MLKNIYRGLWCFAPWFIRRYLYKRAKKNSQYLLFWDERFGQPYPKPFKNVIWIHAVSVGETRAALPIVKDLQQQYPDISLLMTQMTPTGRETAQKLFPQAQCRYLPYDKPAYVQQFLFEHQPQIAIFMETEIWPNILEACYQAKIPVILANARLSEKSLQGYLKIKKVIYTVMSYFTVVCAQSDEDAKRFKQLGAKQIIVTGSSKYDITPSTEMYALSEQFKQKIGSRKVFVCASTREYQGVDEEKLILDAWKHYQQDALLIIIPRHPERFESCFCYAQEQGFKVQKRSDNLPIHPQTQVWIGDSMGELFAYYLCCDIAFVGGSLVDTGCQNIIEPISCKKATIFGFSTYNFADICVEAKRYGVALQVQTADELCQLVIDLLDNQHYHTLSKHAEQFIHHHQGASAKIVQIISQNTQI